VLSWRWQSPLPKNYVALQKLDSKVGQNSFSRKKKTNSKKGKITTEKGFELLLKKNRHTIFFYFLKGYQKFIRQCMPLQKLNPNLETNVFYIFF